MSTLTALAGVVLAIVAIGAHSFSPNLQPTIPIQPTIRLISNVHEVHFPDEVVFRVEAEATSPIIEVTLFYRLARQNIRVYGYPEFTPAPRVSTEFTLRTSGSSYLPSGVEIEYYYRIVDAVGNSLETQKVKLDYMDPSYNWQELRYGELVLLWHDQPADQVEELTAKVSRQLASVRNMLGLEMLPPMRAVILSNLREAERVFPVVSETAKRGHLYGGFAFPDFDLFVLAGLSEDGMVHEMTHLLMAHAVDSPRAKVPAWLNEGLAMYFEGDSSGRKETVAQAMRDETLLRLSSMNTVPGTPQGVRMFYAQSWSLVKYVIDTHGTERMGFLLRTIDSGSSIGDAVEEVYDLSIEELEDQWRREVSHATPLAPRPSLGTIGTTVVISVATAIALAVSAYRWASYRSRRSGSVDVEL